MPEAIEATIFRGVAFKTYRTRKSNRPAVVLKNYQRNIFLRIVLSSN